MLEALTADYFHVEAENLFDQSIGIYSGGNIKK